MFRLRADFCSIYTSHYRIFATFVRLYTVYSFPYLALYSDFLVVNPSLHPTISSLFDTFRISSFLRSSVLFSPHGVYVYAVHTYHTSTVQRSLPRTYSHSMYTNVYINCTFILRAER